MSDLVDKYTATTGDTWPEKPKRMFVSRKDNRYTKAAIEWIGQTRDYQLRMAKWYLSKAEEEL